MTWTDKEPTKMEGHRSAPPLDESLYDLRPQDAAFFKEITGIEDDTALKQHILDIQAKAYKVGSYLVQNILLSSNIIDSFTARLLLMDAFIFLFSPGMFVYKFELS
jgi:hypothetical protein